MFGMNEAQFNAAKRQAKKCGEAMKADVEARGELEAAARAKELSGANQDTHQFSIDLVRKMS